VDFDQSSEKQGCHVGYYGTQELETDSAKRDSVPETSPVDVSFCLRERLQPD
jgi:hypothetical protein